MSAAEPLREARPEELTCELFVPCEGSSVSADRRTSIRGPYGRIGVQTLPIVHPVICVPIEVWGPPHSRALVQVRLERPGDAGSGDIGAPIALTFDHHDACHVGATIERMVLREEGVHALCLVAGDRVLARRRFQVVRIPGWEWPADRLPDAM